MLGRIDPAEAEVTPHDPFAAAAPDAKTTTDSPATPPAHADSTGTP
jgi:hypothetical protein